MSPAESAFWVAVSMLLTAVLMLIVPVLHFSERLLRTMGWASRERRLEFEATERAKSKKQPVGYRL